MLFCSFLVSRHFHPILTICNNLNRHRWNSWRILRWWLSNTTTWLASASLRKWFGLRIQWIIFFNEESYRSLIKLRKFNYCQVLVRFRIWRLSQVSTTFIKRKIIILLFWKRRWSASVSPLNWISLWFLFGFFDNYWL